MQFPGGLFSLIKAPRVYPRSIIALMITQIPRTTAVFLSLAAGLTMASGQTSITTSSVGADSSTSAAAQPLTTAPAVVPGFTWGGDLRLRNEYFNSALTLNSTAPLHEQDYFRVRARLWSTVTIVPDLTFNLRLAAEPRIWEDSSYAKQHPGTGLEARYASIDTFNLKMTHAFGLPLTITAGRQDVQFGDPLNWWLVGDGTPGDGSWTSFLDSVRASLDIPEIKTKVDAVYIYQHARPDTWLPILGPESTYGLTEQNERGVILYASNKSIENTQADGYFIYKKDNKVFSNGDDANIYTLGGKLGGTPAPNWQYSVEGAWQWGTKTDPTVKTPVNVSTLKRDIEAYGWNAKLTYSFKDSLNDQVSLVSEYLSGDNPNTPNKDEMFDVLWGRWPRFSELYIYSYPMENGGKIAQLNNLLRAGASWSLTPVKGMTLSATYNALFAPVAVPTRTISPSLFSDSGHFRGNFLQLVLKQQFNKNLSGHLWAEFLRQGDFYTHRDTLSFLRAEILLTF
jgi:Alginate export